MKFAIFNKLQQAIKSRIACAVITDLYTGQQRIVGTGINLGDLAINSSTLMSVENMIDQDTSGKLRDRNFFVRVYVPPFRIIIVGGVHITKFLAPIAKFSGYDVIVVDPREFFTKSMRMFELEITNEWPDEALERIGINSTTAVVTLTHDSKLDDPTLVAALRSESFYIGALGSKKTHKKRLDRLRDIGFDDETLRRINGPVGLSINAQSPEEIAIAILAQVIENRRNSLTGKFK